MGRLAKQEAVQGKGAEVMQAVPTMLELVPSGVNKWVGLQALLPDLALTSEEVMAIGDGGNDLQIVANVGVGVAMANAVPQVCEPSPCAAETGYSVCCAGGLPLTRLPCMGR